MEVLVDLMEDEEVEEVIDIEYEVLGISPFVSLSTFPVKKNVVVARTDGSKAKSKIAGCR